LASKRIPKDAAQGDINNASDQADLKTRFEEQSYQLAKARTELLQAKVKSVHQDIDERKKYAAKIFKLICWWVSGLLLVICLSSWAGATRFRTATPVLLALVGSTTATVLGLFYIVAHYLFPDRGQREALLEHDHEHPEKSH